MSESLLQSLLTLYAPGAAILRSQPRSAQSSFLLGSPVTELRDWLLTPYTLILK